MKDDFLRGIRFMKLFEETFEFESKFEKSLTILTELKIW